VESALGEGGPGARLGCTSLNFALNGKPNTAAEYDLGAASACLTLEATARGLFVHQMIGIKPDRARELYRIPEGFRPLTGLAIGYLGDPNTLPEKYKDRDLGPRQRNSQAEFVFGGRWGVASDIVR
jgi:hypothetical protein